MLEREKDKIFIRDLTNLQICENNNIRPVFMINVAEETTTLNKIRATMQIISKVLRGTLGPYGSTTIVQDPEHRHLLTKDGYDLMNRIIIDDEVARTILDILRNISGTQVSTVGDGSTSAVVVAASLYETLTSKDVKENLFDANEISSKDLVDVLNFLADELEKIVKEKALPISSDLHELDKIAAIAANNDKETGKLVADIYRKVGKFGFITTDVVETTEHDKIEYREGIHWRRSYIDDCFVYGKPSKKVVHDNPYVFLTTKFFTQSDLPLLADIIGKAAKDDRELLIVCNGADEDVRTFFKKNRTKHLNPTKNTPELVFTVVDIDQVTNTGKSTLIDLSLLCGCDIFDPGLNALHSHPFYIANEQSFIGHASKVIVTEKETQVLSDLELLSEERIAMKNEHEESLKSQIDELYAKVDRSMDEENLLYHLKNEYNILLGNSAIFHVGGRTLTERMSRERLIEDAILACKSALNNGYTYGCNLVVPITIFENKDALAKKLIDKFTYIKNENFFTSFLEILEDAFFNSYLSVLQNAGIKYENIIDKIYNKACKEHQIYNLKLHQYETFEDTDVINSIDTDINIMRTCISIISILATSNQFITLSYSVSDAIKQ